MRAATPWRQHTLCRGWDGSVSIPPAVSVTWGTSSTTAKPGRPIHLRGKWRVGLVAVRDINIGDEVTYDYGVRSEPWMRVEPARDGEARSLEIEDGAGVAATPTEGKGIRRKKTGHKRNYFWCPVQDCASGPVQKITQHLQKVHGMDAATSSNVVRKKRRAPDDAVRMRIPNPKTRSSGLRHIGLFSNPPAPTDPGPSTSAAARAAATATPAPELPAAQGMSSIGDFHSGGVFLDGLHSHLTTRSGGNRGRDTARQMTRYVGKYLHYLNPDTVEEGRLLQTTPALAAAGIGSSGILHRILAHKAAVHYMRLGVNGP